MFEKYLKYKTKYKNLKGGMDVATTVTIFDVVQNTINNKIVINSKKLQEYIKSNIKLTTEFSECIMTVEVYLEHDRNDLPKFPSWLYELNEVGNKIHRPRPNKVYLVTLDEKELIGETLFTIPDLIYVGPINYILKSAKLKLIKLRDQEILKLTTLTDEKYYQLSEKYREQYNETSEGMYEKITNGELHI